MEDSLLSPGKEADRECCTLLLERIFTFREENMKNVNFTVKLCRTNGLEFL